MNNRQKIIEELTEYELSFLLDSGDSNTLSEMVEFFSNGGFHSWGDEKLQKKYDLFIREEYTCPKFEPAEEE